MDTNLRQAEAKAFICGIVSEKELEVVTDESGTSIKGHLTVKTSDTNFVKINVWTNQRTKMGTENKCYAGLLTVLNDYHSIAEVGEENATKVRVSGQLNPFETQTGKRAMGVRSSFFNRAKEDNYAPTAEFSVEMYIDGIVSEVDEEGLDTGRTLVNGWVPTWNGIEPVSLVAEGEIAQQIDANFTNGQTVEFYGTIVNNRIETVTEIPMMIGAPKKKVSVEYHNDLIITGASQAYEEGISLNPPYETATINAAIRERENHLMEEKATRDAQTQAGYNSNYNANYNSNMHMGLNSNNTGASGRTLGF